MTHQMILAANSQPVSIDTTWSLPLIIVMSWPAHGQLAVVPDPVPVGFLFCLFVCLLLFFVLFFFFVFFLFFWGGALTHLRFCRVMVNHYVCRGLGGVSQTSWVARAHLAQGTHCRVPSGLWRPMRLGYTTQLPANTLIFKARCMVQHPQRSVSWCDQCMDGYEYYQWMTLACASVVSR